MADLDELFGPGAWGHIQDQLRRGEDPKISDIAQALRGTQVVPAEARTYIADILENKIHRKSGRKVDKSDPKKLRDLFLTMQIDYWIEVCQRAKRRGIPVEGGSYRRAIAKVSERTNRPEATLDKIYYPRGKRESS